MKLIHVAQKYGSKAKTVAAGAVVLVAAAQANAAAIITWTSLSTAVTEEATAAITAGIGVLALFLGVAGGVRMFRKFIG